MGNASLLNLLFTLADHSVSYLSQNFTHHTFPRAIPDFRSLMHPVLSDHRCEVFVALILSVQFFVTGLQPVPETCY
jgi:hypothetical protein